jgi:large subunit ribosomal protein L10
MSTFAKTQKESEVKDLADKFSRAKGVFFTEFSGLTVEDTTTFRKQLKKQKIEYKVMKNNIIKRALGKVNLSDLEKDITGPTGVVISYDDVTTPAKIIKEFTAVHDKLKIRIGFMEGKVMTLAQIKYIADLPSKEVLLANVARGMKAPMNNIVFVLQSVLNKLVYSLQAIKTKKG